MKNCIVKNSNSFILKMFIFVLILCFIPLGISAQNSSVIKGVVTDVSGEPILGASVSVAGTTNGSITGMDGSFELKVPANGKLKVSFIGYITQEVNINGKSVLRITLKEESKQLNEVVVIGYGTQRKESVTGSVASIKGDIINEVPSMDISSALQGRVAGIEMTQVDSKPGAQMQIRIRGVRSLNASNDPLVVLDGIPFAGSISDIDPNNIKTLDILKDASATAIYGSRGANGVILITTNKGMKSTKAQVTYNMYVGVKTLFARYPMMNSSQFVKLRQYANMYTQNGTDEDNSVNTDWQNLLYKNSMLTNQDLNVTGGTETGNYNFGIAYYRDASLLPGQNYNRASMHASIDQKIGNYFTIGFSTQNNYGVTNGANLGLYTTLATTPISNPYNADGSWKQVVHMANDDSWVQSRYTIDQLGDKWKDQEKAYGTYNSMYGEFKIPGIEGLKYRFNLGLTYRQDNTGSYTGEGVFSATSTTPSSAEITNSHTTNWTIEHLLMYDYTFAEKHKISAVALYSAEQTDYNKSDISGTDVPDDALQYYNLGDAGTVTVDPDNQSYYKAGLKSYMGRVMYSYNDRYMLSAAIRSDGSSRLAKGHRWHTYPAVSAGWNISKESFMQDVKWLDNLKLRVGYGETSNQAVSPYSTLGTLSTRTYNFGTTDAVGYYVSSLPNSNLGWEYSQTWNYGMDFSLFKGRLSGTFEYYVQKTNNLLMSVNLPSTSGVSSYMANVGKTENKGFELTLNGTILNNYNGWTWNVGMNLYQDKNKLTELASGETRDESNWWFVGHPINVIYDYQKIGIWSTDDYSNNYGSTLEKGGNAGMIKVKYTGGYNADGTPVRAIGSDDRQIRKVDPDWAGGFNTSVSYKGFDLNIIGAFKHGGTLISALYSSSSYLNMLSGRRGNVNVDYWTEDNPNGKYPKPGGVTSSDNPKYGSTLGYFSGSYCKIRTITLGYNFPQAWFKNAGINKMRIYCTVQNPFVFWSPYKKESGMDPETNSYGDKNQAVTSVYQSRLPVIGTNAPNTRNYLMGLNITF
jgi:TonB-dependent starch-binding outer membrane protein SusC